MRKAPLYSRSPRRPGSPDVGRAAAGVVPAASAALTTDATSARDAASASPPPDPGPAAAPGGGLRGRWRRLRERLGRHPVALSALAGALMATLVLTVGLACGPAST